MQQTGLPVDLEDPKKVKEESELHINTRWDTERGSTIGAIGPWGMGSGRLWSLLIPLRHNRMGALVAVGAVIGRTMSMCL